MGAASAIAAAKKSSTIKLISFDSSPPQIELLKQGKLAATMGQSPFLTGKLTVTAAVKYLRAHPNGGPVPASAKLSVHADGAAHPEERQHLARQAVPVPDEVLDRTP